MVVGEQPTGASKHVSRTKTSTNVVVSFGVRFFAAESNATYRPFALITGTVLASSASEPLEATDNRVVLGEQPTGAPWQVSRKKTSNVWLLSLATRFVALEPNTMKRPSALRDGAKLLPLDSVPSDATETRVVAGVQPTGAPTQVSRRNMSVEALLSLATRLVASDAYATKRPSALIAGTVANPAEAPLSPFPSEPSGTTETGTVLGVQPAVAAMQVSRRKIFSKPFVAIDVKLDALETKATNRPLELIAARLLSPLPSVPSVAAETSAITFAGDGGGGATVLIGKLMEFEMVLPRDAGLTTVTEAEPEEAISAAVMVAVRSEGD